MEGLNKLLVEPYKILSLLKQLMKNFKFFIEDFKSCVVYYVLKVRTFKSLSIFFSKKYRPIYTIS